MRLRRSRRSVRLWWLLGVIPVCLLCGLAGLLALPAAPGLALQAVGFAPQGSLDEFWAQRRLSSAAQPDLALLAGRGSGGAEISVQPEPASSASEVLESGQAASFYGGWFRSAATPSSIAIHAGGSGGMALSGSEIFAETVWFGEGIDGYPLGIIEYREDALGGICRTWLQGCATDQYLVRSVDFRPNGMVIYGSVYLGGLWQDAGAAVVITSDGIGFQAVGVVINGTLYALPPAGEVTQKVNEWVAQGNAALRQTMVEVDGLTLGLAQMRASDDHLTLIWR
jgi:hypothetical protein